MTTSGLAGRIPAFSAGVTEQDGRVVGCWIVDHRSMLTPRPSPVRGEASAWAVRRTPCSPTVSFVQLPPVEALSHVQAWTQGRDLSGPARTSTRLMAEFAWWLDRLRHAARPDDGRSTAPPSGSSGDDVQSVLDASDVDDARSALSAVGPFLQTLDPDAADLLAEAGHPRTAAETYGWLDRTFVPDAPLAAAWRAKPWMREALAELLLADPALFSRVVAQGRPALDALCADHLARTYARSVVPWPGLYDVLERIGPDFLSVPEGPKSVLRQPTRLLGGGEDPAVRAARLVSRLPRSWLPRSTSEWTDFLACVPAVEMAVVHASLDDVGAMLNARGDWRGLRRRLAAATGLSLPAGNLVRAVFDVGDMVRDYADQVLVPAIALSGRHQLGYAVIRRARNLLSSGRTVCRILEASRRWHAHASGISAALPSGGLTDRWDAALPDLVTDEASVVVLTSRGELADEGMTGWDRNGVAGLSHCVGGYAGTCLRGMRRILSVRRTGPDGRTERLSTVEVSVDAGRVRVHQHRGLRNADPGAVAARTLDAYLRALGDGSLPRPDWLPVARSGNDVESDSAGYDVRAPGAWDAVRTLWDPHLPGTLRGLSAGDLADVASLRGMDAGDHGWRVRPYGTADLVPWRERRFPEGLTRASSGRDRGGMVSEAAA